MLRIQGSLLCPKGATDDNGGQRQRSCLVVCCPKRAKKHCPLGNNWRGATKALCCPIRGKAKELPSLFIPPSVSKLFVANSKPYFCYYCPEGKAKQTIPKGATFVPEWNYTRPLGNRRRVLCFSLPKGDKDNIQNKGGLGSSPLQRRWLRFYTVSIPSNILISIIDSKRP